MNSYHNDIIKSDISENYLRSHTKDGKIPEISIPAVMEAIEKIASKLDI